MISYLKNLDMCEELTTFTFFGDFEKYKNISKYVKSNFLKYSIIIYKDDPNDSYLIVCKNQTCSNKIRTIEELKSIEKNYVL